MAVKPKGFLGTIFPNLFLTKKCFSQCGEELVITALMRQVGKKGTGFFVDVGAFHPHIGSNTYYFYRLGWRGVNIDARPGSMKLFDRKRPRDINIETGIGSSEGNMKYFMLQDEPGMNTFSFETLQSCRMEHKITSTVEVPITTMAKIQSQYVPAGTQIDFVSIDTEGHEMEVLKGFDFELHRPTVFAIELNDVLSIQDTAANSVNRFMEENGYVAVAKNLISLNVATVFYLEGKSIRRS